MYGKTRNERIKNTNIRDMVGVAIVENMLRENKFRWFEYRCLRSTDAVVRRSDMIIGSDISRGRSIPKLILDAVVKKDMTELNFSKYLILD